MLINRKVIKPFFRSATFSRGEVYYNEKRVHHMKLDEDTHILSGLIRGTRRYSASIHLTSSNGKLVDINGDCSCPVGHNCKHVVALLLEHGEQHRTVHAKVLADPTSQWLYQLKVANSATTGQNNSKQILLYLLNKKIYSTNQRFVLETIKVDKTKQNTYKNSTSHTIDPNSEAAYMQPNDRYIQSLMKATNGGLLSMSPTLEGEGGAALFLELLKSERCHWGDYKTQKLVLGKHIKSELYWHLNSDRVQQIRCKALQDSAEILPTIPPYYINLETGECGQIDCGIEDKMASILIASPPVLPQNVDNVISYIKENLSSANIPIPYHPKIKKLAQYEPTPLLKLSNIDVSNFYGGFDEPIGVLHLNFDYAGYVVNPNDKTSELNVVEHDEFLSITRNLDFEQKVLKKLDSIGLIADEYGVDEFGSDISQGLILEPIDSTQTWLDFMLGHKDNLIEQDWDVEISDDFVFQIEAIDGWYADVESSGVEWFSFELGVKVNGRDVNLLPFMVKLLQGTKNAEEIHHLLSQPDDHPIVLKQDNGKYLNVAFGKVRHIIETLVELYDPASLDDKGKLTLSRYQSNQLAEIGEDNPQLEWSGGDSLRQFGAKLHGFKGIKKVDVPKGLKAELRDYQKEGLNWLQFLREYNLGGILADDMGLGKTVQALAHLLIEKDARRSDLPSLVIAPTSLMVNWAREAEKFAPELSILVLQGQDRKKKFEEILDHDVVLTTYPLLTRDSGVLLQHHWHMVILDEAQNIKNPKAKASQNIRQLICRHRLCLTGTPMENHLTELWSQFHFLMPGMLGDEKKFKYLFRTPIEKRQDRDRQKRLRERIAPFMLRREKKDVAKELPPKTEIISRVTLESGQRDLYETIRVSMNAKVREVIAQKGMGRSHIIILDALLKLRQICCHPQLLKIPSAKKIKHSAKLEQLMEMVPEMVEEGRKILLFSQFTSMLAIIEEELTKRKIEYVKLTGQTKDRAQPVDDFQAGKVPVFLISLKAGGSGLNLTAADTVIHYDPWWNPAAENQATDRAYRIGQDKPVFVYKMITEGTVEEKILEMQAKKQALADALFSSESQSTKISVDDLKALFEPI